MEEAWLDDAFKRPVRPDPLLLGVDHVLQFQLEGGAMIYVVADVFLVGEHLMDGASGPRASKVCDYAPGIQRLGDFRFAFPLPYECLVDPLYQFNLLIRSGDQNHSISL